MILKLCYFNNHWNIYFYSSDANKDSWIGNSELTTKDDEKGQYRLRQHLHPEIPVYSFGFMANNPKYRPGHGGEWSSNSRQILNIFGEDLLEIALDQISCAAPISWLKQVMGDKVIWKEHHIYGHIITDVVGEKSEMYKWITIPLEIEDYRRAEEIRKELE